MNDIEAGFYGTETEIWYRSTRQVWWLVRGAALLQKWPSERFDAIACCDKGDGAVKLSWDACTNEKHFRNLASMLDRWLLGAIGERIHSILPPNERDENGMTILRRPIPIHPIEGIPDNVEGIDALGMIQYERARTSRMYVVRLRGSSEDWETLPSIEARDSRDAAERWASNIADADQTTCERDLEVLPIGLLGHIKTFRVYSRPNWIHTASRVETGLMLAKAAKP
jgi:hypothetical protein